MAPGLLLPTLILAVAKREIIGALHLVQAADGAFEFKTAVARLVEVFRFGGGGGEQAGAPSVGGVQARPGVRVDAGRRRGLGIQRKRSGAASDRSDDETGQTDEWRSR